MATDVFGKELANHAQLVQMLTLLHVKTNAAVSMSSSALHILAEANLKPSSKEKVLADIKKQTKEINAAAKKFEALIVVDESIAEMIYHRAYKEGMNDMMFDPENKTPEQIFIRNKRIADNQKWLADHEGQL